VSPLVAWVCSVYIERKTISDPERVSGDPVTGVQAIFRPNKIKFVLMAVPPKNGGFDGPDPDPHVSRRHDRRASELVLWLRKQSADPVQGSFVRVI